MASFDIIKATGYGYQRAWRERPYLIRLAAAPLLIKFACLLAVFWLGWGERFLLQALVMLPAYFADGWMLSHYTRLIFLGQRWPFRPSGNVAADDAMLQEQAQGVLAGTLVYAVARFLVAGLVQASSRISMTAQHSLDSGAPVMTGISPGAAGLAAVTLLVFGFWSFRFLWFYIPAALDYNLRHCAAALRGGMTSFYFLATALLCFVPVLMVSVFIISLLAGPFMQGGGHSLASTIMDIVLLVLRALMDTVTGFIATGAMAYGLQAIIGNRRGAV